MTWRWWMLTGLSIGIVCGALADEVALTTYYPSPRGVYKDLRVTNKLGIGFTGTPTEALEVNGNVKLSGSPNPQYRIFNVQQPVDGNDVATKKYVDANAGRVQWAGYVGPFTGNLGGIQGANQACDDTYPGSHWAGWDEIRALGVAYPWRQNVWIPDGLQSYQDGSLAFFTKSSDRIINANGFLTTTCFSWTSSAGTSNHADFGTFLTTDGPIHALNCFSSFSLACVK